MVYRDQMLAQAAAKAVSEMFNICDYHDRPIFLAAVRVTIEGAIATLDSESRTAYENALACMEAVVCKRPRRRADP